MISDDSYLERESDHDSGSDIGDISSEEVDFLITHRDIRGPRFLSRLFNVVDRLEQ